jgi:hypothetical protein
MAKLYVIGGPAKVGKSTIVEKMKEMAGKQILRPSPNNICRPIVKSLFAEKISGEIDEMNFKGISTFGLRGSEQKPFEISFKYIDSLASSPAKNVIIELPTDYVRTIIRLIFAGENRGLSQIGFRGTTTFTFSDGKKNLQKPIAIDLLNEDPNTWNALVGIIDGYDRGDENDLLVEGVAITPEKVHQLKLEHLAKKVLFVGYSDPASYVQSRIAYAKEMKNTKDNNYDWSELQTREEEVYTKILLKEATTQGLKNLDVQKQSRDLGYKYLDLSQRSFEAHVKEALDYLFL